MPFGFNKQGKHPEKEQDQDSGEGVPAAPANSPDQDPSFRPPTLRPSFMDDGSRADTPAGDPLSHPPIGDAFFVTVRRQDTAEVHRFDKPEAAQTFVEGLLEQGFQEDDLAAFSGHRLEMRVRRRPVVKLVDGEE